MRVITALQLHEFQVQFGIAILSVILARIYELFILFFLRLIDREHWGVRVVHVKKNRPRQNKKKDLSLKQVIFSFCFYFKVTYVSVDGASCNRAMVKSALKNGKKKGKTWTTVNPNVPDGEITWLMDVKVSAVTAQESAVKFRIK